MIFSRFVAVAENRSALAAAQSVATCLCSQRLERGINPLYLHGLPGTGKTHLVTALVEDVTRRLPRLIVNVLQAADFRSPEVGVGGKWLGIRGPGSEVGNQKAKVKEGSSRGSIKDYASESFLAADPDSLSPDLLVVEDLQHLARRRSNQAAIIEAFVQTVDDLLARRRQVVFTANVGPARLAHLPARLVSRLACGLVVGLEPLGAASRLALLQDRAQRRQLAVSRDVLTWLAKHVPGGTRQLLGALVQLEGLSRMHARALDVSTVAEHFRSLVDATRLTVERIAERVGSCFQVAPRDLQSRRRSQSIVMPRQVGMYLARKLTGLSLDQIGAYFGGRDHSTVLYACHKVERALDLDPGLSGVVKELQAELC